MNKLTLLLLLIIIWLQYSLFLGKNGIYDYLKVKNEIKIQKELIYIFKARNKQLFIENNDLYNGLEAIEERARNDLGMKKNEEIYYHIINKKDNYSKNIND
ncbi:cell division protein FtsB [Candidatus Providencia siddallii]|uniref:Cell division protein FtsB n=1 Tax=Candidatus Providencia siddallii TaxID=1715285 RepID=A0ABM9NN99_9GAMM